MGRKDEKRRKIEELVTKDMGREKRWGEKMRREEK